ncbi:MAG: hypothetical protein V5A64_05275 [Candidatus Thermoplasmatota archaeon]
MKKAVVIIFLLVSTTVMLCGCQEEQKAVTAGEKTGQISLKSDVVKLVHSSFNKNMRSVMDPETGKRHKVVRSVEVEYYFKNIADRPITISVTVEFYDKDDDLVAIVEGAKNINLPKGYTESATNTPTNKVKYDGKKVGSISRAVIIAEEV